MRIKEAQLGEKDTSNGNRSDSEWRQVPWSSMGYGALLTLAFQFTLAILGSGLGLAFSAHPDPNGTEEAIGFMAGAFVLVGSLLSFGAGGYASAVWARCRSRLQTCFCAWGTWALCALILVFFGMAGGSTLLGGLFLRAGMPSESASVARTLIEELEQSNFRVITDMKLFEGKAVTSLAIAENKNTKDNSPSQKVVEDLSENSKPSLSDSKKKKAETIANLAAVAGLLGFAGLLLGAFSAWGGAVLATR
ncbi:MAG: hypothetical protein R3B54_03905 [Bdellovibrionota bacterium]